jgi:uncharacterized membrane protein YdbT with pleckstrin-like domain
MAFPRKLLNEGEEVVVDLRPHWLFLAKPVGALVLVIVVAIIAVNQHAPQLVKWALLALLAVAVVWSLIRYAKWATTNFTVTTDRIVHRTGVLAKHGREIPLDHLNDISYQQSFFERLVGIGDLLVESAGQRGQETFPDLPKPGLLQNEIYRQIEAQKNRMADRMAGRRELSIPEQIEKLDELRQRGIISQAEFDAKKSQLLERM